LVSLDDIMSEELAQEMTFNNLLQRPETSEHDSSSTNMSEFLKEAGITELDLKDFEQSKFVSLSYMFKPIDMFHLEILAPMMNCWQSCCNASWISSMIVN